MEGRATGAINYAISAVEQAFEDGQFCRWPYANADGTSRNRAARG
jgi:hypothetical protein